jgi:hypothetical protein
VVQVEVIQSTQPNPKKRPRKSKIKLSSLQNSGAHYSGRKSKKVGEFSFLNSIPPKSPLVIGKSKRRMHESPSSNSTAGAGASAGGPPKTKGPKKSKRGRVKRGGFGEPSAGLPGNEEVDPPRRSSVSTPASRWLDQIKR